MSIKSDHWIRRMALGHGMIEPFESHQVREGETGRVISYGTSSYGYDIRCANEFKIFTNINSAIVDPKNFDANSFVDIKSDVCIIPPNSFALARTVEYLRIPRNVLTICLGKSTYARCFRGDTRVALADGTAPTLEEMALRAEQGERFWGYGIGENGRLILAQLEAPRYIGRDSLVEVMLDNGKAIRATPDHLFMLRDGRWQAAGDLTPGASLMPLYRHLARGYEMVYQPLNGHLHPTHRLADEWNLRHGIYGDSPDTHRHHLDFDRLNNNPWNIARMDSRAHIQVHNAENFGEEFDPDGHSAAIRDAFSRNRQNPERRVRQGERMKPAWQGASGERRQRQAEIARNLRLRSEITEDIVRQALNRTGSIRAAAHMLDCDRSLFRRFPQLISKFRGQGGQHPHNHKVVSVRPLAGEEDVFCLSVPEAGNFALEDGVFVHNCGIIVNVTPLEPEWEGHVTLEFSNTTPLPAKIYANEGVAQILFFESDEVCDCSYRDRGGKYQGQQGVTLPRP